MSDFTPGHALIGGVLIGLGLAVMLVGTGQIAGLSGIVGGIIRPASRDRTWRLSFLVGAIGVGAIFAATTPGTFDHLAPHSLPVIAVSGVLVGVGTRLSNGCTSGHGLCGISRLSRRSILATMTFMVAAMVTATIAGRL